MCSIPGAALAFQAIGTVNQFVGQLRQGRSERDYYNYQAAVNRNNKIIADRQAEDAIQRGKVREDEHRMKVQRIKGSQRVAFAANNVDLGSDVVVETVSDTAMLGELDALTIRSNAEREAFNYRVQGSNFEASANLNQLAGENAVRASRTEATSTILGGAATTGFRYVDFKNKGIL